MGPPGKDGRPLRAARAVVAAVALVGIAAGVAAVLRHRDRSHVPVIASASASASSSATPARPVWPPAGPAELAVVAPLVPGATLGKWTVRSVGAVVDGRMRVTLARDRNVLRLEVVLASDDGPAPPASSGAYAIFYRGRGAEPDEASKVARALADVIAKNHDVQPPAGLAPFHEAERDPTIDEL